MSYLHFASTSEYRERIIQMGESPERVYCFGDTGVENILKLNFIEQNQLAELIGFPLDDPYAMVTFHPVTLERSGAEIQLKNLISVLDDMKQLRCIFTKANSDEGGQLFNSLIDQYVKLHPERSIAFTSMGQLRYLSAMKFSVAVIGNSSSGIVEAPALGIPTVNIGDRQKGRLKAASIIDCEPERESIKNAINLALSESFRERICKESNPYQGVDTSQKIVETIDDLLSLGRIDLKKQFYDIKNHSGRNH